ncbi:MAG: aminotransferase class V-fold PLP-dependent enzyme [Candidatus Thorarchaeota archaeon]|jgi:cysteine desulfurase/selenocysteine lyase
MTDDFDIKSDFGVFDTNPDLAYFDSASTTLVPKVVSKATIDFLDSIVASARRGAHSLAIKGSTVVENVRSSVAKFIQTDASQTSFQKSIPSAVASFAFGYDWIKNKKNKIVIAQNEEHSVYVALLRVAEILHLDVEILPLDETGRIHLEQIGNAIDNKTGIVAVGEVSVGIGVRNPVNEIARIAHEHEAVVLSDATRSIPFSENTATSTGADIIILSANIGFMAPPGLAIQWISKSLGEQHRPGVLGGSSVANVNPDSFEIALQPDKFESGILNIPAIAGLGAALQYLEDLLTRGFHNHIRKISKHLHRQLDDIPGLKIFGKPNDNDTIIGFNLGDEDGINCHDAALFLDESGIAVRSGLLCAHPLIKPFTNEGMLQVSLHAYNSINDINRLCDAISIISEQLM